MDRIEPSWEPVVPSPRAATHEVVRAGTRPPRPERGTGGPVVHGPHGMADYGPLGTATPVPTQA